MSEQEREKKIAADIRVVCDNAFRQGRIQGQLVSERQEKIIRDRLHTYAAEVRAEERVKREELEEKYNEVMGAIGVFAVTHDEKALQKLCALADDWLNESEAPAPDPHTPGPDGPQGGC